VVQVFIANPTGCTAGTACPEYDSSPEYVNVWIDWNGDNTWDPSEKVLDQALTGYMAINYQGTMTAIAIVTPPSTVTSDPTWLRANLGWDHDPNDPCESTWTWGNVVDKEIHLETPRIKSIEAKGVGTPGDNPQTGTPVRMEADVEIPTGYELVKCTWTGDLTNGEGDVSNSCRYDYTPATGAGPAVGTYGSKTVRLTVTYRHTSSGATGQVSKEHTYKVFYRKTGDDDSDGTPNWYEYWGDDGAVPGLAASNVSYDATLSGYGSRSRSTGAIRIGDLAAGTHYPSGITVPAGTNCPGGTFGGAKGCDCAVEVVVHENRHGEIYHNWDTDSTTGSCDDSGGPWRGCTDSDTASTHARPGDDLPDDYEGVLGTNPNAVDSCSLATLKSPVYAQYGDNELSAMLAADGQTGVASKDWANPGKQSSPSFAPPPEAVEFDDPSLPATSGLAGTHALPNPAGEPAVPGFAGLLGTYSDNGVDAGSNGLYDYLALHVGVHVDVAMDYYVVAWLEDSVGTEIAWARTILVCPTGDVMFDVLFDGSILRSSGLDGPYAISQVELRAAEDDSLLDSASAPHGTAAYSYLDFDPAAASFSGDYSDAGIDIDTNGRYDSLSVEIGIAVATPGAYRIVAELGGTSTICVSECSVMLDAGLHSVALAFSGSVIGQSREDGPYLLRRLWLEDALGATVELLHDPYTTASYTCSEFENGVHAVDVASFHDEGLDLSGNGSYDYLRVEVTVDVPASGEYSVSAHLLGGSGQTVSERELETTLQAGANTVVFDFPGSDIRSSGVDGPYEVGRVLVLEGTGSVIDYVQQAHTTQAYTCDSFATPLVSLMPQWGDAGQDTDGDGLYEYLLVTVTVEASAAGVVVVHACLVDSTGIEIARAEANRELAEGAIDSVTLAFSGDRIVRNGRDGPYEVRDLYVYHTGDPEAGVFQELAHVTQAYSSTDFDFDDTAASFRVDLDGNLFADGTIHAEGFEPCGGCADVAEWVAVSGPVSPGDVLEHDPSAPISYRVSQTPCSRSIAGVVATRPCLILGAAEHSPSSAVMALMGIVPVKVTDEGGPIGPGDLLVSSSVAGHAMRWNDSLACPCALVGKALEPMEDEQGVILVLLSAH